MFVRVPNVNLRIYNSVDVGAVELKRIPKIYLIANMIIIFTFIIKCKNSKSQKLFFF